MGDSIIAADVSYWDRDSTDLCLECKMPKTIPFAQYLFKRLGELNCKSVHGVPGDFFLRALDHLPPSGLKWIGNASELCAGYAADGYARVGSQLARHHAVLKDAKGHPTMVGALMTTYGVGELSAINAVAGSYSESVPVVHMVSTPSRRAMREGSAHRPIHHTLADGRMDMYAEMTKHVTCAQANLHAMDDVTAAAEAYDKVLETAILKSKPVYISLSSDMVEQPVLADMLEKPLNVAPPFNNWRTEDTLLELVFEKLRTAKNPLIIADGLSYSFNLQPEINALALLTGIPAMAFTSGKGVVDEGLHSWDPSLPNTTQYSQTADLVLMFGPLLSDTNTARWSAIPDVKETIMFNLDSVEISGQVVNAVRSKSLLDRLVSKIKAENPVQRKPLTTEPGSQSRPPRSPSSRICQDDLWLTMSSFIRPEDTLLLANGTPLIGGRDIRLQSGCQVYASAIWNAIGSMLPAAQGIAAAKRDHNLPGRTILFEGDGSFQVTCQAISDIIRYRLDVTIFIANNSGYTYERWLNGMEAEYNDVPSWRYTEAARFFGADENDPAYPTLGRRVETWGQLQEVLADEKMNDGKGLKIIDVVMDPQDVPEKSKPGLLRASEALRSA